MGACNMTKAKGSQARSHRGIVPNQEPKGNKLGNQRGILQSTAGTNPYCIYYLRTLGKTVTSPLRGNSLRVIGIAHTGYITSRLGDRKENCNCNSSCTIYCIIYTLVILSSEHYWLWECGWNGICESVSFVTTVT